MVKKIIGLIVCLIFIIASVYTVIGHSHSLKINNYSYIKSSYENNNSTLQEPAIDRVLIIGRIQNLIIYSGFAIFEPIRTRVITFNPFSNTVYTSGVMLVDSKLGILTNIFILGFFNLKIYMT
jgi:hypothetical protein